MICVLYSSVWPLDAVSLNTNMVGATLLVTTKTIVTSPADIGTPKLIMKTKDWAAAPNGGKSLETKADSIRANCRKNVPEIHSTATYEPSHLELVWECCML